MNASASLSAFARTSKLVVALSSMVALMTSSLTGCVGLEGSDSIEFEDSSANASADDEDFRSLAQAAQSLSADPVFHSLLASTVAMTAQYAASQLELTDHDLNAYMVTVGHADYSELIDLDQFLEASAVERALVDEQMELVTQLIASHELQGLSATQLEQLFAAATVTADSRAYLEGAIENEIHVLTGTIDTTIDDCEALCIAIYATTAALELSGYISILAGATLAGPVWPFIVGLASVGYGVALASAEGAKDECFGECAGEVPSEEECLQDSDCASNEFCWAGVIGIGANECRPEKSQGETCARHGQCSSDCCKLHVWTNALSKTCRPANKCN